MGYQRGVLIFLLVVAPLIELVVGVTAVRAVGWLPVLVWLLVAGVVGMVVVRRQGVAVWRRVRSVLGQGQMPEERTSDTLIKLAAGVLLLLPGLVSDAVGLLLFVPAVRRSVREWVKRRFWVRRLGQAHTVYTVGSRVVESRRRRTAPPDDRRPPPRLDP